MLQFIHTALKVSSLGCLCLIWCLGLVTVIAGWMTGEDLAPGRRTFEGLIGLPFYIVLYFFCFGSIRPTVIGCCGHLALLSGVLTCTTLVLAQDQMSQGWLLGLIPVGLCLIMIGTALVVREAFFLKHRDAQTRRTATGTGDVTSP